MHIRSRDTWRELRSQQVNNTQLRRQCDAGKEAGRRLREGPGGYRCETILRHLLSRHVVHGIAQQY